MSGQKVKNRGKYASKASKRSELLKHIAGEVMNLVLRSKSSAVVD